MVFVEDSAASNDNPFTDWEMISLMSFLFEEIFKCKKMGACTSTPPVEDDDDCEP